MRRDRSNSYLGKAMKPRLNQLLRRTALWALIFLVVGVCGSAVEACPTCKEGMAGDEATQASLIRGYFYSIIFMMSMPFLILTGLSTYFYLEVRRARRLALDPSAADVRGVVARPA